MFYLPCPGRCCIGCGMTDNGSVIEDVNKKITTTFFSDQVSSNEVNVFFLDIDNINSGTETEAL